MSDVCLLQRRDLIKVVEEPKPPSGSEWILEAQSDLTPGGQFLMFNV